MAQVAAVEYLKKLMDERGSNTIDGVVVDVSADLADVRVLGSSRVLRDVPLAQHIPGASPGQHCSLGVHAGRAYVLAVFESVDDGGFYTPRLIDIPVLSISVYARSVGYRVSWSKFSGAAYYELYANEDATGDNPHLIYSGTDRNYTVPYDLEMGYFAVRAVARDGTQGPLSEWTADVTPPDDPTNLTHSFGADGHHLNWEHAKVWDVGYFEVYRNTTNVLDGNETLIYQGRSTQCLAPYDPAAGYYFGVRAVGWKGLASSTEWTGPHDPTPTVPTVTVTATRDGYAVTWTREANVAYYKVQKATDGAGTGAADYTTIDGASAPTYPYDGQFSYFAVAAVGYDGTETAYSAWVTDTIPPASPTNFTHTFLEESHKLHWQHPNLNDVMRFEVIRNTSQTDAGATPVGIAGRFAYPPYDLVAGCFFAVRAVGWDGSTSNWVWLPENNPQNIPAPTNLTIEIESRSGLLLIDWDAVSGYPAFFELQGSYDGQSNWEISHLGSSKPTVDTPETHKFFRVRVIVNFPDQIGGQWSSTASVGSALPVPPAPTGVSYQSTKDSLVVKIDQTVDQAHLDPNFKKYRVFYSTLMDGSNAAVLGDFTGSGTTFAWPSDTRLIYYFAVKAVALSDDNDLSPASPWTEVYAATDPYNTVFHGILDVFQKSLVTFDSDEAWTGGTLDQSNQLEGDGCRSLSCTSAAGSSMTRTLPAGVDVSSIPVWHNWFYDVLGMEPPADDSRRVLLLVRHKNNTSDGTLVSITVRLAQDASNYWEFSFDHRLVSALDSSDWPDWEMAFQGVSPTTGTNRTGNPTTINIVTITVGAHNGTTGSVGLIFDYMSIGAVPDVTEMPLEWPYGPISGAVTPAQHLLLPPYMPAPAGGIGGGGSPIGSMVPKAISRNHRVYAEIRPVVGYDPVYYFAFELSPGLGYSAQKSVRFDVHNGTIEIRDSANYGLPADASASFTFSMGTTYAIGIDFNSNGKIKVWISSSATETIFASAPTLTYTYAAWSGSSWVQLNRIGTLGLCVYAWVDQSTFTGISSHGLLGVSMAGAVTAPNCVDAEPLPLGITRGTGTSSRPSSPGKGHLHYRDDLGQYEYYDGATWSVVGSVGVDTAFKVDASGGTGDTYGVLSGTINGSNRVFTTSNAYLSGTLTVYLNGQLQTQGSSQDWTETNPGAGTFTFAVAPQSGDQILVTYLNKSAVAGNADLLDGHHASDFAQTVSANRPGVTRLYRRDSDTPYNVQTYWTGARWRLYGYNGDTAHADTHVGFAEVAGSLSAGMTMETIAHVNLTSNGLITLNNIPDTYQHLMIVGRARTDRAGYNDTVSLRFNNNSLALYTYTWLNGRGDGTINSGSTVNNTQIDIALIEGNDSATGSFPAVTIIIPNYRDAQHKGVSSFPGFCLGDLNGVNMYVQVRGGVWRSTAAITRIDLFPLFGTYFLAGTQLTLYGLKSS